ncbi:hypothetical protein BP5796_13051 [Coleophoma crateriformis]|uniref:Uncharacterized protein n=1 Tax=Coleophoma crateriformis TaxID=565419 RepID=A0A3D8Q406_9HELO|nr:hypothetical protein BP5796_13051 [Coleophoma crateriformis]
MSNPKHNNSDQTSDIFSRSLQSISDDIEQALVLNGNFLETPWSLQNRYYILAALYENDPMTASRKFQRVLENTEIAVAKLEIIHHALLERNCHLQGLEQQRGKVGRTAEVDCKADCMTTPDTNKHIPFGNSFTSCFCTPSGNLCVDHEIEGVLVLIQKEVLLTEVLDSYADALWSITSKKRKADSFKRFQKSIDAYSSAQLSELVGKSRHEPNLRSAEVCSNKTSIILRGGGIPSPPASPSYGPLNSSLMDYELTGFSTLTPPESPSSSNNQASEMSIDEVLDHLPRNSSIDEVISVSPTEMGPQALISWKPSRASFPKAVPVELAISQSASETWSGAKALGCDNDIIEYEISFHDSFVLIPAGISLAQSELTGYKELEAVLRHPGTFEIQPALCFDRSFAPSPTAANSTCDSPLALCQTRSAAWGWYADREKSNAITRSSSVNGGQQDTVMEDISTSTPSAEELSNMWVLDSEDIRQWWHAGNAVKAASASVAAADNKALPPILKTESPGFRFGEANYVHSIILGSKQPSFEETRGSKRNAPLDEEKLKQDLALGGICWMGKRRKIDSEFHVAGRRIVS